MRMLQTIPYIWDTLIGSSLDKIKVQNQVQCGNNDDEYSDSDAERRGFVNGSNRINSEHSEN